MTRAGVFYNGAMAGYLEKLENPKSYQFWYTADYLANRHLPAISLSFPKRQQPYTSSELFPFFFGMLAEGINKKIQCRLLKIDEEDDFTRLIRTAGEETIGAITVRPITEEA